MLSLSQKAPLEQLCNIIQHDKLLSMVAILKPGAHGLCKTPKPLVEIPGPEGWELTTEPNTVSALESRGHSARVDYFHSRRNVCQHSAFCSGASRARYLLSVDWMREVRSKQQILGSQRQAGWEQGREKSCQGTVEESFDSCDVFAIFLQSSACGLQASYFHIFLINKKWSEIMRMKNLEEVI